MKRSMSIYFLILLVQITSAQPLQLLPSNPHYFLFQNKPTVIVGSGEHYGSVINNAFDYEKYLRTLKSEGLNTTRLFMGAYFEKPGAFGIAHNTLAPADQNLILPWQKTGDKYDLEKWNDNYFERLQDLMIKATENNVIVEVNLFSAYYGAGWAYHPFNGNNNVNGTPRDLPFNKVNTLENGNILKFQRAYVIKLIQVLNEFDNFYFEIQNEPWADNKDTAIVWNDYAAPDELKQPGNFWKNTLEVTSQKSIAWQRTVSQWITGEEKKLKKKHLISQNIANFEQPVFDVDPNISIYTFHYAKPNAVHMNYGLNKVIGFNETGFAGKEDITYRRQAWRFMMSGGGLFGQLDYSFSTGHETGDDESNEAPGGGSIALRKSFKVLKDFIQSLDLATLKPDESYIAHVENAFAYSMKTRDAYVIYMEPMSARPTKFSLVLPKGNYNIEWMDVTSGKIINSSKIKVLANHTQVLSPLNNNNDKVLKLTRII
ncbi:MAG: hypothetical protein M3139_05200 [Bacteroidota bacterium]|nr:hypothetical protein [Bacteroidota bacterium]